MKRHALIKHSGEVDKKFQCTICGRRYAIKQSLRYHLESKHNQGLEGDEDELQKINEHDECTSNHNHDQQGHPTNSLTGLEEALEELRRYEDDDAIEYYPNSTRDYPSSSQAAATTTTSTATPSTSSVHQVDPLSAYLNPPPLPSAHSSTLQSSQHSAMYAIPHSPDDDQGRESDGPMLTTLIPPVKSVVHRYPPASVSSHSSTENVPDSMLPTADSSSMGSSAASSQLQCDYCKQAYSNLNELTKHKKRCNRYRCQHCQRAFSQMGNLRRHIQILHSGAKPYKCKMCSKAYGIRQSLRYHMQNTHGIREQLSIDVVKEHRTLLPLTYQS